MDSVISKHKLRFILLCLTVFVMFIFLQMLLNRGKKITLASKSYDANNDVVVVDGDSTTKMKKNHYFITNTSSSRHITISGSNTTYNESKALITNGTSVNVVMICANIRQNWKLKDKLENNLASMMRYATLPLKFYLICDSSSLQITQDFLKTFGSYYNVSYEVVQLHLRNATKRIHHIIHPIKQHFSYKTGGYYSDDLFFLSLALHHVLPVSVHQVIVLDIDLVFQDDIYKLWLEFPKFQNSNIIGLAREQQPVYHNGFWRYRKAFPKTRVGGPPPHGLTGFNSGVTLLDLRKMRDSELYNSLLTPSALQDLTDKFMFEGHLGDQDFFAIVGMQHEDLFYILDCSWNRQMCTWWKDKGYQHIFNLYHNCTGKIHIYHGNCKTEIRI